MKRRWRLRQPLAFATNAGNGKSATFPAQSNVTAGRAWRRGENGRRSSTSPSEKSAAYVARRWQLRRRIGAESGRRRGSAHLSAACQSPSSMAGFNRRCRAHSARALRVAILPSQSMRAEMANIVLISASSPGMGFSVCNWRR